MRMMNCNDRDDRKDSNDHDDITEPVSLTRRQCFDEGVETLTEAGIDEAHSDVKLLMEYITDVTYNDMYLHPDELIPAEAVASFREALKRRTEHIPVQYITGRQEFMGLDMSVSPDVLIPRFDTETLVEEILRLGLTGIDILDVCTGSGCILISLLHYMHDCRGVGVDISDKALKIADSNARRHKVDAKFFEGDLFDALIRAHEADNEVKLKYDLIVSNPPYIPTDVIPTLMEEVRDHEPIIALDGSSDGLIFYRRIVKDAPKYLVRGGRLYMEIGWDQGASVSRIMEDEGFDDIEIYTDLGGNDRVICGEWRR